MTTTRRSAGRAPRLTTFAAVLVAAAGCPAPPFLPVDAGGVARDAGLAGDAGGNLDAGGVARDAGLEGDAGVAVDAGVVARDAGLEGDAGVVAQDAGSVGDAGPSDPLHHLAPTEASTLTPANPFGKDEDPALLTARDGSLLVAWFSNRNGPAPDSGVDDEEIFVMRSPDGATWAPPVQATRSPSSAFTPSLAQDAAGTIHLAWWQVTPLPPGCSPTGPVQCTGTANTVHVKSSPDGVTWDLDDDTVVAAGPGDWLPSLVVDGDRRLIVFAAVARNAAGVVDFTALTLRLFAVEDTGAGWSAPRALLGLHDDALHDTYPHVTRRADGTFDLAYTRYDATRPADPIAVIGEASTDTWTSTSTDGLTWQAPALRSDGAGALDVFPSLLPGEPPGALWLTTALGGVQTVELPPGGAWPAAVVPQPGITGYSPRVVATATPGVAWAVWVEGTPPRLHHRFLPR